MDPLTVAIESPLTDDLALLFDRHTAEMQAETPPESIHMLPRAVLVSPAITFLVSRVAGEPVAMGALKQIDPGHGELKSMHVLAEWRGRGLSRAILTHLMAHARDKAMTRVSLETGAQPGFVAARALYTRAGFTECPAFASYQPDPNSVFMTRAL